MGNLFLVSEPRVGTERHAVPILMSPSSSLAMTLSHLNPAPRISGIDLKQTEALTRRLLLSLTPIYHTLPSLSLPPPLDAFLNGPGFSFLHPSLDPASRGPAHSPSAVPPARAARKRLQIANLVALVAALPQPCAQRAPHLLDMCGGCGHVGLVLAALLPRWRVTVVDTAEAALRIARRRAREAELGNFDTLLGDVGEVKNEFDVAVALHACGGASDAVITRAGKVGAMMVVVPCCVGGGVAERGGVTGSAVGSIVEDFVRGGLIEWRCAKSTTVQELLKEGEFGRLARAADFGERGGGDEWRRVAKMILELDRKLWLEEGGYEVRVVKMRPLECTPKNDVIVAWKGKGRMWGVDEEVEAFLEGVKEGNVIRGLGVGEVREVEQVLRMEVCDGTDGEFWFPKGLGKRKRKVVHAVAESMGLYHESFGKGKERRVYVRRTPWWPLFFDNYVGVGGPEVERVCEWFSKYVPTECLQRRGLLRGDSKHVTIVRPSEFLKLTGNYKKDRGALLERAFKVLKGSTVRTLGVGKVRQKVRKGEQKANVRRRLDSGVKESKIITEEEEGEDEDVGEGEDDDIELNEAYFVVLEWTAANAFREELELARADFHITLGFTDNDIHTFRKDRSTLFFEHTMEFCPF